MAFIGPWEIALIIIVVLIIFGPKKLPELAKSVGSAIRQYKKATEGFLEETPEQTPAKDEKVTLLETAKKLDIQTEGKTPEEISEEIIKKSQRKTSRTTKKPTAKKPTAKKKG